jgi:hypothetical protein
MKQAALITALVALVACDKPPPARPDEATFRAASPMEKCRLTEPRAVRCSDDLMVAELRSMTQGDKGMEDFANVVEEDVKLDKPTSEDRHVMHKTSCLGSVGTSYQDAVFECWAVEGCKKFAECVMAKPARATTPNPTPTPASPPTATPQPAPGGTPSP